VGLVDDERVVAREHPVPLELGQQDAVGHHLDPGALAHPVGEAHGVAHQPTDGAAELLGHPFGHSPGGDAAGLGVTDQAALAPPRREADLGQLRALARAGLAGYDHHLVVAHGGGDLLPPLDDGEPLGPAQLHAAHAGVLCRQSDV
jgi:hypothetical protein